jgi:hypothetical protein
VNYEASALVESLLCGYGEQLRHKETLTTNAVKETARNKPPIS